MDTFIINLISKFGYFGMFIGMILESVIIIIPSELILATGGILASKKIFTFIGAFITGILGNLFCAIIIYFMGYFGGTLFVKKYGKYFFMKEEDIEKTDNWYKKHGMISACIGRNIPIIRTLISLPIGIYRLSFLKFIIFTLIGSIPWTFIFIYVGYEIGNNWIILSEITSKAKIPIIIFLIVYVLNKILIIIKKRSDYSIKNFFSKKH